MPAPIFHLALGGYVLEVTGGSRPGDHRVEFLAKIPNPDPNAPDASVPIVLPVETIDQARAAGARLYQPMRLTFRLEPVE